MSYWTSVAVMSRLRCDELLPALQAWAEQQERSAGFATIEGGSIAADAWVIVGQVNHLDHDSLKAAIRDAAEDRGWNSWFDVSLTTCSEEDMALHYRLGEDGEWR